MRVRKAVIPVAGFGTRFLPVTKSVPKGMIPIIATPVIEYIVEAAVSSGIEQVILVTGNNRGPIENFFDTNFELETALEQAGKHDLLKQVRRISDLVDIVYVPQKRPRGNGHAILMARQVVGDEPFLMLWGDDILLGDPPVPRQLIEVAVARRAPALGVQRVPRADFEKYGMVGVEDTPDELGNPRVRRVRSLVEKPEPDQSPSDLAQIGGYVLTPDIFELLSSQAPDASGEIYLAPAVDELIRRLPVFAYEFVGTRYDAGNKLDYLRATVELALADADLGPGFRKYLKALDLS